MDKKEEKTPLVSVCCITYNHEKYIRDALEGFVMQKTTFPFEVLIHDDASTDHTADIIREYEVKYPDIIKPIYQTENQYSKGVKISQTYLYPRAKGKYIALCEGDDFWTDKHKLQIQASFMEQNPEVTICAHRRRCLNHLKKIYYKDILFDITPYTSEEICKQLLNCELSFGTQTMMFRKDCFLKFNHEIIEFKKNAPMGDMQLWVVLTMHGKCAFLPQCMATYRIHANSVTHFDDLKKLQKFDSASVKIHERMAAYYGHNEWLLPGSNKANNKVACEGLILKKIYRIYFSLKQIILKLRYYSFCFFHH